MLALILSLLGIGSATTAAAIFFPGFGLALAAFGKAALTWLSKRSLAEIAAIALILALAIDHLALLEAHRENGKLQTQLASAVSARDNYKGQLDALSTKKNEQAAVTTQTVTKVVQGQTQIRTIVQHVHDAPNPPDCATPDLGELSNAV